jgi:DNA-binding transcriptional LysR family regulator
VHIYKTNRNFQDIDKENQIMSLPPIRHLEAFMAVAQARSFRVASERMGLSQPALSQNIALLESSLGVTLFTRSTRSVRLTADGAGLQERLAPLLPALRDAIELTRRRADSNKTLQIGILASAAVKYLPEALVRFRENHPDVAVTVRDGSADQLFELVHQGKLDIAVSSFLPHDDKDVHFKKIIADPFRAVFRRDHPLAEREVVSWSELLQYDFIGANAGSGTRYAIDETLKSLGLPFRTVMEFGHYSAVAGMVEAEMGVSALPRMNCPPTDDPLLCSAELVDPVVFRDLGILTNSRDGGITHYAKIFHDEVEHAAKRLTADLELDSATI